MSQIKPIQKWRATVLSPGGPGDRLTRLVLLALAEHMDAKGGSCFPSMDTIATQTAMSERSVGTHLARAEATGWIKRWRTPNGKGWKLYHYQRWTPLVGQGFISVK